MGGLVAKNPYPDRRRIAYRCVVNEQLNTSIDEIVERTNFSGAVHVSRQGTLIYERAAGFADRAHGIANTVDTRFGTASAAKGFTALVTMSLVADGLISLDTRVRDVVGELLPEIDPAVTVRHLLTHTSGIGDYLDEGLLDDIDGYAMPIPVHQLAAIADYVVILGGHPMRYPIGERFEYNNSGFVVLSLIAEMVSGSTFYDLVAERVCRPAGMAATAFLRNDELPGTVAFGYVRVGDVWRTNLFHLPVRGSGDGGLTSTLADFANFWPALFSGSILPVEMVDEMVREHVGDAGESRRYGLGFWLRSDRQTVMLEGYDAGISFRSASDRTSELLFTVVSNTSAGAWPIARLLGDRLPGLADG